METENETIDAQHRELVACLNEMTSFIGEGQGDKVHAACCKLPGMLRSHFEAEEAILRDAKYPDVDAHANHHAETNERYNTIFTACGAACKDNRAGSCLSDLTFVLVEHILRDDLLFKSFLQTKGFADNYH